MSKPGSKNLTVIICITTLSLLLGSCKQPSSFDRTNTHDPLSYNFKPVKEKGLKYTLQNGTLTLSWSDTSSVIDGFIVEKAIDDTVSFKKIKILHSNTHNFEDKDIKYFNISYRVSPYSIKDGEKYKFNYKELILNRYQPGQNWYDQYSEKKTVVHFRTIRPIENFEIDGYELERAETVSNAYFNFKKDGKFKLVAKIPNPLSKDILDYSDTTLVKNNHLYGYRIRAYNNDGKSFYAYTHCCYGTFNIIPPTITGITPLNSNSIVLNWKFNDSKADGVIIERSEDKPEQFKRLGKLDSTFVKFTDKGLDRRETYYYRVSSLGSEFSEPATVKYQLGISQTKYFSAFSAQKDIEFRPGTDEFVSTNITRPNYSNNKYTELHFWKENEDKPYYKFTFTSPVADIKYKGDGSYLALIFEDGYIRTFKPGDLASYAYSRIKEDANGTSISIKPNSNIAAVGYNDGTILIVEFVSFDAKPAVLKRTIKDFNNISNLSYSMDGKSLIATGNKGTIIKYDVANNYQKVKTLKTGNGRIYSLKISHHNKWIVTCDVNNLVNVWSLRDLSPVYSLSYSGFGQYHHPISLAFSADDSLLFAGSTDGLIFEWDMNKGMLSQIERTEDPDATGAVVDLDVNTKTNQLLSARYSYLILWNVKKQWIKKAN